MNKEELLINLEYLLEKYIIDYQTKIKLKEHLEISEVKFMLAEIDINKSCDYDDADRDILKDIYFYYC